MGNLFIQTSKGLFADHLRNDLAHGLVRNGVLVIEGIAVGKILKDTLDQFVRVLTPQGRDRNDFREIIFLAVGIDAGKKLLLLYGIHLVDHKDHGGFRLLKLLDDVPLTCADKGRGLHEPADHVHFIQRPLRHVHHIVTELILCLVNAGRIEEDDLPLLRRQDRLNAVSGGLRLIRSDGDLLPDQMVHQRGFPHVRATDQSDKS